MTDFTLSQMIEGFLLSKTAQGLSVHTIANYRHFLDKFAPFVGADIPFSSITRDHITRFLAWLQADYRAPRGQSLSAKTVSSNYAALSTFWTWAKGEGFTDHHLLENIPTPKAAPPVIDPLTKEQVKALLKACNSTRPWKERPETVTRRPTASRGKALLLFFLDTGCRVSEVCDLTIGDVDKSRQRVKVRGKGGKERFVYFGKRTGFAPWQYLATRDDTDPDAPLFALSGGRPFTRDVMYRLFKRIGQRAGIDCYPHLFRQPLPPPS